MRNVLLLGAGKIGRMIARFLTGSGDYDVLVGDQEPAALARIREVAGVETIRLDADDPTQLARALDGREAVISALSFAHNPTVAGAALKAGAAISTLPKTSKQPAA